MAVLSRFRARLLVPLAAVLARPLEDLEKAVASRVRADLVSIAAPMHGKLQQAQVAHASRVVSQALFVRAVLIQQLARLLRFEHGRVQCLLAAPAQRQKVFQGQTLLNVFGEVAKEHEVNQLAVNQLALSLAGAWCHGHWVSERSDLSECSDLLVASQSLPGRKPRPA